MKRNTGFYQLFLLLPVLSACSVEARQEQDGSIPASRQLPEEPTVDTAAFFAAFEQIRVLTLEENEEVITVIPIMSAGRTGELIVVDEREAQVRLYGEDGSLRTVIGRRGEGPGEFTYPVSASRTEDNRIVVGDISRITVFSPEGGFESSVGNIPMTLLIGVKDLGADRFLLLGPGRGDVDQPRFLHIWDSAAEQVERSFLPMGLPPAQRPAGRSFPQVSAVIEGDTIWAVWALSDTLYKFSRGGERLAAAAMPLPQPTGPVPVIEGVVGGREAVSGLTQVADVFLLGNGEVAVQAARSGVLGFETDLLIMDRVGQPKLQLSKSPRLLLVDGDEFYFDDPASILPNRLIVVRRRVASRVSIDAQAD